MNTRLMVPGVVMDQVISTRDVDDLKGSPLVTLFSCGTSERKREIVPQDPPPASPNVYPRIPADIYADEQPSDEVRREVPGYLTLSGSPSGMNRPVL